MRKIFILHLFSFLTLLFSASWVDQAATPLKNRQQQILYEQQLQKLNPPSRRTTQSKLIPPIKETNASLPCVTFHDINTSGITLIDPKKLKKILRPYIGRCSTIIDLAKLIRSINNQYIAQGYISSFVYLEPQKLSGGVLRLSAIEGTVEKVRTVGIPQGFLFMGIQGAPLNLRRLEQSLSLLDRLKSWKTDMQIRPGRKVGTSEVVIEGNQTRFPIYGSVALDNFGSHSTGKTQLTGNLVWENMLRLNDTLTISCQGTPHQNRTRRARDFSIGWGLPVGTAYLKLSYSDYRYRHPVRGIVKSYPAEGQSRDFSISIEKEMLRSRSHSGTISLGLERKKDTNKLAHTLLDVSTHRLTILNLSYTHHFSFAEGYAYLTLAYQRGTSLWGAYRRDGISPEFSKGTFDMGIQKFFYRDGRDPLSFNFIAHGQISQQKTPGSEMIQIGGAYSVRGFESDRSLSGNRGIYFRSELAMHTLFDKISFSPYLGLDAGFVPHNSVSVGGQIWGGTIGLRFALKDLSVHLSESFPLKDSRSKAVTGWQGKIFGLNLRWTF